MTELSIKKPRFYQKLASSIAAKDLGKYKSILIVSPTRTGKTLMVMETIMKMNNPGRVVVVTPRTEIARQWAKTAREDYGLSASIVGGGERDYSGHVICSTMASMVRHCDRLFRENRDIGVLIMDEAHHLPSPSGRKIVASFKYYIPNGRMISTTATTGRSDKQDLSEFIDAKPIVVSHDMANISGALLIHRSVLVKTSDVITERAVSMLCDAWEREGGRSTQSVFFVDRVDHINLFIDELKRRGVTAKGISGKTPLRERRRILEDYDNGDLQVMVNVQVLTEGIDINQTQIVVLASQPATQTPLVQKAGRALGRYPGKKSPVIIVGKPRPNKVDLRLAQKFDMDVINRNGLSGVSRSLFDAAVAFRNETKRQKRNHKGKE